MAEDLGPIESKQISEWKEKYGFIYKVILDGKVYYFRTLNRNDYLLIQQKTSIEGAGFDNELETIKQCVLYPQIDIKELNAKAGLVSVLSEKIMLRSGFQQVEEEEL